MLEKKSHKQKRDNVRVCRAKNYWKGKIEMQESDREKEEERTQLYYSLLQRRDKITY